MGRSADQIAQEIAATRGDMETRIVALRQAGERTVRTTARRVAIAAGVGAGAALALGAFILAYRLSRPATPAERLARILPRGWWTRTSRARRDLELRMRRGVPSLRLYVGERRVGEEPDSGRAERIAIRAAQAFATALASAIVSRAIAQATGSRKR